MTDDYRAASGQEKPREDLDRYKYDMDDLRAENRRLRVGLEQMRDDVLRLSRALEPMHRLHEELSRSHEELSRQRDEADRQLAAHHKRAERLAEELQGSSEHARNLDGELRASREYADSLVAALHAVHASSSWRLTLPLRWSRLLLSRMFRKLRSRENARENSEGPGASLEHNFASEAARVPENPPWRMLLRVHERKAALSPKIPGELWQVEGPIDSSYSLAVVNREFARGLARAGERVALVSRDGPGRFAPASDFLAANPDIDEMVKRAGGGAVPAATFRFQYPPHVADMGGGMRVLSNYAWEESGFPAAWVREFNATLDLITVLSGYVAKVLRDNGVCVPIHVVGAGVDQMLSEDGIAAVPVRQDGAPFRFLHVSSCFPRKGVDVLLTAWGAVWTQHDRVELVIKTFPNIHNTVESEIAAFQADHPDAAPIALINEELDAAAMRALYLSADALVCPTRGEGFGLPLAEALALGKPVITAGYGGQSDFCTAETAWLCDYHFDYARTHFDVTDSIWTEPEAESLARILREVFEATPGDRSRRAEAGQALVLSRYTWDQVTRRTQAAVEAVRQSSSEPHLLPSIGVISTWNSRCGIAAYTQALMSGIEPARLLVFASKVTATLGPDDSFVRRCWTEGWDDPLDELFEAVRSSRVEVVVLQFNFGFYRPDALARLLERLHADGILVFMTLHSTTDVELPGMTTRLKDVRPALARVCRLLAHSVHDLNRLKDIGLVENVTLFPMGQPRPFNGHRQAVRRSLGLDGKKVVACFGYLLPNKGLPELIQAFALLRSRVPDAHLMLLNALYPLPISEHERYICEIEISRLGLSDSVTLVTDFLDEAEVLKRLAAADVIVYPYQRTQESASAAVKMGLGSGTAVAVTPLPIFADVATVTHTLPGTTPAEMADGLVALLSDPVRLASLTERQRDWTAAHAWDVLSHRLDGMILGEVWAAGTLSD